MIRTIHGEIASAFMFLCVGLYCIGAGSQFEYYGLLGPGPGFFPILVGSLIVALSVGLFISIYRSAHAPSPNDIPTTQDAIKQQFANQQNGNKPFFEETGSVRRVGGMLIAIVATTALLEVIGFRLAILLFALSAPSMMDRPSLFWRIVLALLCSFGVAYAFENWLGVQLPKPSIQFIEDLGL
uniref:tripartite tricarboxylate transporter TctB family protein n=1 Tax=Pararhizobium sp. IMCC3301 TaxID=3067904 RepID=UPI0027418D49|nr:tripartite tricarboxylate transporter TctB family protein [Pararhizobium sp. IMCC3301]